MKECDGNKGERDKKEWPPSVKFEVGDRMVAVALDVRRDIKTQFGDRDVVEVVIRGQDETKRATVWWPRRLPLPAIHSPFRLIRQTEKIYKVQYPETPEEAKVLWSTGDFPKAEGGAAGAPASLVPPTLKS